MGSGLQAVPPLLNGGARGTWLASNPGATRHLQVSSAGAVSTSAFDGSFGTLTGTPTTLSGYGIIDAQPLDADLTAIAALTTTAFGRSLLTQADAPTARTTLGAFASAGGTLSGAVDFSGATHAGIRLNNLTTTQRDALTPAAGQVVWNTTTTRLNLYNGTAWTAGFVRLDGDTMTGSLLATSFEARNATTATSVLVNNTWTSSTNRETGYMRWANNILSIGTEKGSGGGTARALQIETDGILRLGVQADYSVRVGDQAAAAPTFFTFTGQSLTASSAGRGLGFYSRVNANNSFCYGFAGDAQSQTSNANALMRLAISFQPTSGDATYSQLSIGGTVNQTGGASGITRGILVSQAITAAADYRAYDCTNNTGFAYHSSGTAPSRFGGVVQFPVLTVATLPAASGVPRARAFVSDSTLAFNSTNLASTLTGGGANFVPVYSDGTNWRIG